MKGETVLVVGEWRCSCGAQHVWAVEGAVPTSLMAACEYCEESAEILPMP